MGGLREGGFWRMTVDDIPQLYIIIKNLYLVIPGPVNHVIWRECAVGQAIYEAIYSALSSTQGRRKQTNLLCFRTHSDSCKR